MKNEAIASLMQPRTHCIAADDTVEAIEALMTRHQLQWAPVLGDRGELLGVISQTDLLRFHLDQRDPQGVAAWQLCTYRPITVPPDATVQEVARLMVEHRIHHVVVTEHGAVCGVVSSLDFVRTWT